MPRGIPNKKPVPADPLDQLAAGDHLQAIAMLLWKDRYRNPEFAVQIDPADLKGFEDCTKYLGVTPKILIRRPSGQPAYPPVPPSKRYPDGLPGRPAEPARPYVLISMVDGKTGDAFKPIENSEDGAKLRDKANELRAVRERVPLLAQAVAANAAQGTFSNSEVVELCNAAIMLARA